MHERRPAAAVDSQRQPIDQQRLAQEEVAGLAQFERRSPEIAERGSSRSVGIEQRAATVALVAARRRVAAMRAGADDVAVGQEAPSAATRPAARRSSISPAASSRR